MKELFNKYKKHIPNFLTTLRLGVVPAFWILTLTGNLVPATILFGSACITDALDGYLARKWQVQSIYGKVTDPLADKMLVMSALLLNGITVNPVMLIPFALESGIAIVNIKDFMKDVKIKKLFNKNYIEELVSKKNKVQVSQTGREKTIALMSTVSLGLLNSSLNLPLEKIVNILILITSTMEAATLTEYVDAKILKNDNSHMRMPEFVKEEDEKNDKVKEKVVQNSNNVTQELNREETIELLKKERITLTQQNKNQHVTKKEKTHKPKK